MKTLSIGVITLLTMATLSVNAGEVICGKTKASAKTTYPINKLAIEIAQKLDLKTCNRSDRFGDYMKSKKHTGKVIQVSKKQIKTARAKINNTKKGSFSWGK